MKKYNLLLALSIGLYSSIAASQELKSLNLKLNRVAMNSPTELSIEFKENRPQVWCGASIDWGDGVKQDIRIGDEGFKTSPLNLSHSYSLSGTFNISIQGKTLVRGLGTAVGCDGSPPITRVTVVDVEAIKAQQLQAAAEAKKKEEQLAFDKAKKEAEDRQRQLAEKELDLKRRELEMKEEMLKKEEELRKKSASAPTNKPTTPAQSAPSSSQPSSKPSSVKPADAF
jgi:hypothetical protein